LNIEGMCATPSGDRLYLGLRSPLLRAPDRATARAIVIPLDNPAAVVEEGAAPRFGEPLLWDLGGAGVRDMAYSPAHDIYFVVAGPAGERGGFSLYRWSGADDPPLRLQPLGEHEAGWKPEAVVAFEGSSELLLLSDDGSLPVEASASECMDGELGADGNCENKRLQDAERRTFRGVRLGPRIGGESRPAS
jgi:hypothetical protein